MMYSGISRYKQIRKHRSSCTFRTTQSWRKPSLSSSTDLTLRDRLYPAYSQIDTNHEHTNNPDTPCVVHHLRTLDCINVVSEDDGKDDTPKVSAGAGESRHDAICVWVDVRNQGEVQAVGSFEEERESDADKADHGRKVVRVGESDRK